MCDYNSPLVQPLISPANFVGPLSILICSNDSLGNLSLFHSYLSFLGHHKLQVLGQGLKFIEFFRGSEILKTYLALYLWIRLEFDHRPYYIPKAFCLIYLYGNYNLVLVTVMILHFMFLIFMVKKLSMSSALRFE